MKETYGPRSPPAFVRTKLETIWLYDLVVAIVRGTEMKCNVPVPISIPDAEMCKVVR